VTASEIRELCHQQPTTICTTFVKRKLSLQPINTPAINYGRENEIVAISSFVTYQRAQGKIAQIESCGLLLTIQSLG